MRLYLYPFLLLISYAALWVFASQPQRTTTNPLMRSLRAVQQMEREATGTPRLPSQFPGP